MTKRPGDVLRRASVSSIAVLAVMIAAGAGWAAATKRTAPSFKLPSVAGTVESDSLRGHVVVLDFWASWCEPCRRSFPWMGDLQKRRAADGLEIVAVNLDKSRDLADGFLDKHPAPFTIAFDPEGKVAEAYKVSGMPSTFLIGRDGTILESHVGFDLKKTAAFEARIAEALKQ